MTADTETYTLEEVDALIWFALRLGFQDDVRHWREVRARIVAARNSSTERES